MPEAENSELHLLYVEHSEVAQNNFDYSGFEIIVPPLP